ncbi:MAG: hypothetical protein HPY59_09430 [Anaerolineae bacterium]|nr:hypothetical protein [Anaerolineae bacterium]
MAESSKRVFGNDLSFLNTLNLTPMENSSDTESPSKERKSRSKEWTKEEKKRVICRLIDHFQTH